MALANKDKYKPVGGITTDRTWPEVGKDLEVGDSIEGEYAAIQTDVGPNKANIYVLSVGSEMVGVWGSTVLDSKFSQIQIGSMVGIEFLGHRKPQKGGKPYKDYFVGVMDEGEGVAEPPDGDNIPF